MNILNEINTAGANRIFSWWMRQTAAPDYEALFGKTAGGGGGYAMRHGTNYVLQFFESGGSIATPANVTALDTWQHCMMAFHDTITEFYVDGILVDTDTHADADETQSSYRFCIGAGGFNTQLSVGSQALFECKTVDMKDIQVYVDTAGSWSNKIADAARHLAAGDFEVIPAKWWP